MTGVEIVGAAMTRFGKFPQSTVRSLAETATADALADAGLTAQDVDIVFFSNASAGVLTGQENIRGQVALRHTGLLGLPIVNVENACASASTALHLAIGAVASGSAEVALAVGAEKLSHEDKARTFAAFDGAVDVSEIDELKRWAAGGSAGSPLPLAADATAGDRSFFMDIYAANTRTYMEQTGATETDIAQVAVKSHAHAALNPNAQYRTEVTVDEVLASRTVAPPLTLLMCSPIGDGAAAIVVCSDERAKELDGSPVRVLGSALVSGTDRTGGEPPASERAARRAYERAGIGPDDVDVVELHDATASAEIMTYEELALCPPGNGPELVRSGATALGGRQPVNPSGGLLSKGHPIGATGCAQVVELVEQLRGRCGDRQVEGARVALAENGGGFLGSDAAAVAVTILGVA